MIRSRLSALLLTVPLSAMATASTPSQYALVDLADANRFSTVGNFTGPLSLLDALFVRR
jgi:hypothetical protein